MQLIDEIKNRIIENLTSAKVEIIDQSQQHAGHGDPNKGSHFNAIIISDDFVGRSLVKRHQKINELLAYELSNGVHALSIQAMTAEEWTKKGEKVMPSPKCLGGGKGVSH